MAVVNKLAVGLPDKTAAKPGRADVRQNHGALRTSCFIGEVANGDSATSTIEVARLPSHARVARSSVVHSSGIAGATDADIGTAESPDCLADGITLAAAATVGAASNVEVADLAKPLWEIAGLASDPKQEMPILLTLNTAATAAGVVCVDLVYVTE